MRAAIDEKAKTRLFLKRLTSKRGYLTLSSWMVKRRGR
jgi:hypothetical protein